MAVERHLDARLSVTSATLSDIGGRASNQDLLGSAQQDELACFVLCDGVGGHQGGEIASRIVVEAILERFQQESLFGERALRSYVDCAIARVVKRKQEHDDVKNMSATLAAVLLDVENRSVLFAHLGDTRIYLFRRGRLLNVTRDHSLVQQFIDAGYCKPSQLRTHALRSTLFAAVGIDSETAVDAIDPLLPVQEGDALLLCTDGFWEWIAEESMERAFDGAASVDDWLANMAALASAASAASGRERDNASAIAIWLGAAESDP